MDREFDNLLEKACALHADGALTAAVAAYQDLLRADPGNDVVTYFHALARFDLGHRAEAIAALEGVLEKMPDIARVRFELARMLERDGRLDDALGHVRRLAEAPVPELGALVMVGHLLQKQGDTKGAIAAYERALDAGADHPDVHMGMARALLTEGRWAGADAACDTVLTRRPGLTGAMAMKSVACCELGRADEARAIMDFDGYLMAEKIHTPVGYASLSAFNTALANALARHPTIAYEPADYSTIRGYHTGDITDADEGPISDFLCWLRSVIDAKIAAFRSAQGSAFERNAPARYALNAWGVIMEDDGHQAPHIHRDAWMSGVYYVQVPGDVTADDPNRHGWIEFGTPYDYPKRRTVSDTRAVLPEAGMAILFPAYFYHRTIPLRSSARRVSLAFDVIQRDGHA